MDKLRDEIRTKFPNAAAAAATASRRQAIRLFCIECMGGSSKDARECETRDCFLWPYGPAARFERQGGPKGTISAPRTADLGPGGQR